MAQRTILVIGGALAGPTAAARAREMDQQARIVLIERNGRVSYALCGLAFHLSGEVTSILCASRRMASVRGRTSMRKPSSCVRPGRRNRGL